MSRLGHACKISRINEVWQCCPTTRLRRETRRLPLTTYKAGETILTAGSKAGLLLILKSCKVAVIKDQVKIAEIAESGALFGELSALLD
jgi:signal-transduction protein with cAMP-binding, CBS, and nucleotidyltransferase domain